VSKRPRGLSFVSSSRKSVRFSILHRPRAPRRSIQLLRHGCGASNPQWTRRRLIWKYHPAGVRMVHGSAATGSRERRAIRANMTSLVQRPRDRACMRRDISVIRGEWAYRKLNWRAIDLMKCDSLHVSGSMLGIVPSCTHARHTLLTIRVICFPITDDECGDARGHAHSRVLPCHHAADMSSL